MRTGGALHAGVAQLLAGENGTGRGRCRSFASPRSMPRSTRSVRGKLIGMVGALPGRAGLDAATSLLSA